MADMNMNMGAVPPADVTDDDKLWALLSWIFAPLIPLVVLLMDDKKARPYLKYNAIQALIVSVVGYAISGVLSAVIIGCFLGLAVGIYMIVLAVQSYQGKWVTIPFVTDFAVNQGWIDPAPVA